MTHSTEVKLSNPRAMPYRAHPTDAGADLVSTETLMIYPGDMHMVDTGVALAIPEGYVGLVTPRSSQGKIKISLANTIGVIDSSYRGNIKVMLFNGGEDPYEITKYTTRIAQLIITPVLLTSFVEVDALPETVRGTGGFGSTGV